MISLIGNIDHALSKLKSSKSVQGVSPTTTTTTTQLTSDGKARYAQSQVTYTQPQFYSPLHTPQNWQIPAKRREVYQWLRYFAENEPKVAAALDFYSCFEPNMQVLMADGTQQAIAEIQVGDLIRSHDGTINPVVDKYSRHTVEEMLKFKIAGLSAGSLKCTKEHKILTEINGKIDFVQAMELKPGDYLLTPVEYPENGKCSVDNDFAWLVGAYAAEGCGIPYEHTSKKGKKTNTVSYTHLTLPTNREV